MADKGVDIKVLSGCSCVVTENNFETAYTGIGEVIEKVFSSVNAAITKEIISQFKEDNYGKSFKLKVIASIEDS
jgi:hypothetical protein